jgi:hypothetical protein
MHKQQVKVEKWVVVELDSGLVQMILLVVQMAKTTEMDVPNHCNFW